MSLFVLVLVILLVCALAVWRMHINRYTHGKPPARHQRRRKT